MVAAVTNQVVAYRARNLVNGKHYIGVTKRGLGRREHEHRYAARTGSDFLLHKAIRKYGDEAFVFEVIFDFDGDYELAMLYEAEAVEKERPAYNLVPGGLNRTGPISDVTLARMRASHVGKPSPFKGVKRPEIGIKRLGARHRPESIEKMRLAQKLRFESGAKGTFSGKKHTQKAIEKMVAAKRGRPGPWAGKSRPEAAVWLRAANLGRPSPLKGIPMSAETRAKVSAAKKGCAPPPESDLMRVTRAENMRRASKARQVPVECVEDGRVFESVTAAADFYRLNKGNVHRAVRNYPRHTVAGRHFRKVPRQ